MKKSSLGVAIKSGCVFAVATLCTQAFAQPEIYGQVRMSIVKNDKKITADGATTKQTGRADLGSGNSRIGIKGSEPLTANTDLEYRLEYRVDVAESTGSNFSARHGSLALNNKQYGKLLAGRTIRYDDNLDVSPSWWRVVGTGPAFGDGGADWVNNSIVYTTPKFNNGRTDVTVQYGMDEGGNGYEFSTFKDGVKKTEVKRDFFVVGTTHKTDNGSVGLAYIQAGKDFNSLTGSMSVDLSDKTTLGVTAHRIDYNSSKNEIGGHLALSYKVSEPLGVWVEGAYADNYKGFANSEQTKANVGIKYDLNKSTMTFASVGYSNTEEGSTKTKGSGVETGIIYKF